MALLLVKDDITFPFQLVTVGYLALGNLVSLLAEKFVEDGSFAFLMQHSNANLAL
jgi:hypothetical protein